MAGISPDIVSRRRIHRRKVQVAQGAPPTGSLNGIEYRGKGRIGQAFGRDDVLPALFAHQNRRRADIPALPGLITGAETAPVLGAFHPVPAATCIADRLGGNHRRLRRAHRADDAGRNKVPWPCILRQGLCNGQRSIDYRFYDGKGLRPFALLEIDIGFALGLVFLHLCELGIICLLRD